MIDSPMSLYLIHEECEYENIDSLGLRTFFMYVYGWMINESLGSLGLRWCPYRMNNRGPWTCKEGQ